MRSLAQQQVPAGSPAHVVLAGPVEIEQTRIESRACCLLHLPLQQRTRRQLSVHSVTIEVA